MFRVRYLCLALAAACLLGIGGSVLAAEVDCDATYCFQPQDFQDTAAQDLTLRGICITGLPDAASGTAMLGSRVLQPGDILTADQVAQMTFAPLWTQVDAQAEVTYLPIYDNLVGKAATMTISIKGKKDEAPVAQDSSMETYKNLPNEGRLLASDPEGKALTYTLVRSPKRGEVVLRQDGSFLYTPKKNKVGVDSFTFTATDPAGNVSREATVTIQILKPTSKKQYQDTVGMDCRFAAEWLRNTGLFEGETIGGETCFNPEKQVSQGEFLAMLVKLLDIPTDNVSAAQVPADTPSWLKPYLAAAMRAGLTTGLPDAETGSFCADTPVTGAQMAVMIQNALDLSVSQEAIETEQVSAEEEAQIPVWAASSLTVLQGNGLALSAQQTMTRGETAQILYQVSKLSVYAPGMAVLNMQ